MICPHCGKETDLTISYLNKIIETVCQHFNTTHYDLKRMNRQRKNVIPRHIAIYLCVMNTNYNLTQIAQFFNGRHRTTIKASSKSIITAIKNNDELVDDLRDIENKLGLPVWHQYQAKKILKIA